MLALVSFFLNPATVSKGRLKRTKIFHPNGKKGGVIPHDEEPFACLDAVEWAQQQKQGRSMSCVGDR